MSPYDFFPLRRFLSVPSHWYRKIDGLFNAFRVQYQEESERKIAGWLLCFLALNMVMPSHYPKNCFYHVPEMPILFLIPKSSDLRSLVLLLLVNLP